MFFVGVIIVSWSRLRIWQFNLGWSGLITYIVISIFFFKDAAIFIIKLCSYGCLCYFWICQVNRVLSYLAPHDFFFIYVLKKLIWTIYSVARYNDTGSILTQLILASWWDMFAAHLSKDLLHLRGTWIVTNCFC